MFRYKRYVRYLVHHILRGNLKPFKNKLRSLFINTPDENSAVLGALRRSSESRVMIDVGACNGSSLVGFLDAGFNVYAFEPDSRNRELLEKLVGASPSLLIDARAVSSTDGEEVILYRSEQSQGISGLSSFHETHYEAETVLTVTLRTFMQQHHPGTPDYLKIDTEGFDLMVLKGTMPEIVPNVVMCEFEDRKTTPLGYSWRDICEFLVGHGYQVIVSEWRPIVEYGAVHSYEGYKDYPCSLENADAWGNILGFRDESIKTLFEKILREQLK